MQVTLSSSRDRSQPFHFRLSPTALILVAVGILTAAGVTFLVAHWQRYRFLPPINGGEQASGESQSPSRSSDKAEVNPDLVVFADPRIEFIVGPQLKAGSAQNPWPWFDATASGAGLTLGAAFPLAPPPNDSDDHFGGYTQYYDTVLTLYINAYREPNAERRQKFITYARKAADSWWQYAGIQQGRNRNFVGDFAGPTAPAPRMVALNGLMLRALDGRPELWDWIHSYVRAQLNLYLMPVRLNSTSIQNGVRDPGYLLLYAANLAKVLPDSFPLQAGGTETNGAGLRAQYATDVQLWVKAYWRRLQIKDTGTAKDGAWVWGDEGNGYFYDGIEQPFHVGILLEGLIAVHRLTGQPEAKEAILMSVTQLYTDCFDTRPVTENPKLKRRWFSYIRYGGYRSQAETKRTAYETYPGGGIDLSSGYPNYIKEARQLNSTIIHSFGYAYALTRDPKYKRWGDDVFSASFGGASGPGADGLTDLAYLIGNGTNAKSFNQNYRSSGKYLAWRLNGESTSSVKLPANTTTTQSLQLAAPELISTAFLRVKQLSSSASLSEAEVKELLDQMEDARLTFLREKDSFVSPQQVLEELKASIDHTRTALAEMHGGGDPTGMARTRLGWAAARLKRANDQVKQQ